MKAVVTWGNMDITLEERPVPEIGEGEVLVRVEAVGICGSDIPRVLEHVCPVYPTVLGHEFCGIVERTGPGVRAVKLGERVAGIPLVPCFSCGACKNGLYGTCERFQFIGTKLPGAMAEYVKAGEGNVFPLPRGVTPAQGALFEPATVALHAILSMGLKPGDGAVVIGCGTIGLMAVQLLRMLGAGNITALDIDGSKRRKALALGADEAADSRDAGAMRSIRGAGRVLECVGAPQTVRLALELAGPRGTVMQVGIPHRDVTLTPEDFDHISRRELTLRGSWMSYSAPFPGREWEMVRQGFEDGSLRTDELIQKTVALRDLPEVFRRIHGGEPLSGKVLALLD